MMSTNVKDKYAESNPEFRVRLPKQMVEGMNTRLQQLFPDMSRSEAMKLIFDEFLKESADMVKWSATSPGRPG